MPDRRSKRLLSSVSVTGPAPRRRSRKDIVREEVEAAAAALPTNSNQTLSHESTRVDNRSHDDNVSTMIPFNKSKLPTSSTACGSDKGVSPRKKLRSDQYSSADPNDAGTTINDKKEAEAADDDLVVVAVTPAAAGIESIALPEGVWEIFSPAYDCYSGITKAPLVSSSITNSSNNNNKALCFASPSPQQRRGNVGTALPSISTALLKKSGTSRRSLAHRYMTTYGADYLCSLQCKERVEHRIQQEHRKLFRLKQDRRQQHAAMLHSSENSARSWESASTTTAILEGQLSGHGGCSNSSPSSSSSSSTPLATQDSTSGRDDMMDEASWENRPLEMGQTRLTAKMRRVLVLWISEVVQQYKLSEATYHLSITLLDAILCHASSHLMPDATAWRIQRTDFQELGW